MEAISYLNTRNLDNVKPRVMIELLRSHTNQFNKYKKNEEGDDITHICNKYTIVKIYCKNNEIVKFPIPTFWEHSSSSNCTYSLNLSVRTQS